MPLVYFQTGELILCIMLPFFIFRHGRLRERDQILAIDGQPLDISHQEAIRILQSAGGLVEIVVARGPVPQATVTPGDQEEQVTDTQKQSTAEVSDMVCIYNV